MNCEALQPPPFGFRLFGLSFRWCKLGVVFVRVENVTNFIRLRVGHRPPGKLAPLQPSDSSVDRRGIRPKSAPGIRLDRNWSVSLRNLVRPSVARRTQTWKPHHTKTKFTRRSHHHLIFYLFSSHSIHSIHFVSISSPQSTLEAVKMVNPLSLEPIWLNKRKFEEAERIFYEAKYGGVSVFAVRFRHPVLKRL